MKNFMILSGSKVKKYISFWDSFLQGVWQGSLANSERAMVLDTLYVENGRISGSSNLCYYDDGLSPRYIPFEVHGTVESKTTVKLYFESKKIYRFGVQTLIIDPSKEIMSGKYISISYRDMCVIEGEIELQKIASF